MSQIEKVKESIRQKIKRALGVELSSDEQNFFLDAGVDSLAFLNVVQALEKEYLVKFKNDTLPDLSNCTLLAGAVVELVEKREKSEANG
jgi:acyl carrier protein